MAKWKVNLNHALTLPNRAVGPGQEVTLTEKEEQHSHVKQLIEVGILTSVADTTGGTDGPTRS